MKKSSTRRERPPFFRRGALSLERRLATATSTLEKGYEELDS